MEDIFPIRNAKKVKFLSRGIEWRWEKLKKLNSFRDISVWKKVREKKFFAKKCTFTGTFAIFSNADLENPKSNLHAKFQLKNPNNKDLTAEYSCPTQIIIYSKCRDARWRMTHGLRPPLATLGRLKPTSLRSGVRRLECCTNSVQQRAPSRLSVVVFFYCLCLDAVLYKFHFYIFLLS